MFLSLFLFLLFNLGYAQEIDEELMDKAQKVHDEAIVIDAHAHPMIYTYSTPYFLDLGNKSGMSQTDFVTMEKGGVDAVFLSMPLVNDEGKENPSKKIIDAIEMIYAQVKKYNHLASLARTPSDIRKIQHTGKRVVLFGIEYPSFLEGHTEMLELYYKKGVRLITIAHDRIDRIADSETDDPGESGLSLYGKDPWNCSLYDLVFSIDTMTVEDVVSILTDVVKQGRFDATEQSQAILEQKALLANIHAKIVNYAPRATVGIKDGVVTIGNLGSELKTDDERRRKLAKNIIERYNLKDIIFTKSVKGKSDHINPFHNLE